MATYSFADARQLVVETVLAARRATSIETVPLHEAAGRVLAEPAVADRNYPPVARSLRDGFALRSADLPGALARIGEARAGTAFNSSVGAGQCVEIMTGAPVPAGADAVVMVEQARREGETIHFAQRPAAGEFVNPAGVESARGMAVIEPGVRLGFAQIALLATFGYAQVKVHRALRVAILATGDEVVPIESTPGDAQVRNSNSYALATQVRRAGGVPTILPVAPDELDATRRLIAQGLEHDLLLLSGGVSAGKYDYVEPVLGEFGAEFYFDRVLMQPGQPAVFGRARERFFFGLPGNPGSTMVTFEVLARAALQLLEGETHADLRLPRMRLTADFKHKPGMTRFLPARVNSDGTEVTPVKWQGSSDVPSMARANAFMVCEAAVEAWKAGDPIGVLLQ